MATTRALVLDDAPSLANLVLVNRDFLAPWQPDRPDQYFTRDGQLAFIQRLLEQQAAKVCLPLVILDEVGAIAVSLQSIIRGAFQSCSVGYWLAESAQGRRLATRAVGEATEIAFEVLGLHRVQAETLARTTCAHSGSWIGSDSSSTAGPRPTCKSPVNGRTTCSTSY